MSGGFRVRPLWDGSVNQAAVEMTPDVPEAIRDHAFGMLIRAVVLAVYYPEEDAERVPGGNWAMTVDVRTIGEKSRYLAKVPVYEVAGFYDEDIRIPRPASVNASSTSAELVTEPAGVGQPSPTDPADTDGDVVLIGFEDNDFKKPFCLPFGPPHPKRKNFPAKADGRVRRIRHNGTLIEIDKDGNILIDASAAKTDALAADGSQVDNPAGGNITIKTHATPGLLNLQEATDAAIKGDAFKTAIDTLLDQLSAWAETATGAAPVGPGAGLVTAITNFKNTAAALWLSTRVKVG